MPANACGKVRENFLTGGTAMGDGKIPPFRQAAICSCGDHGFVGLTLGKVALFDAEHIDLIANRLWSAITPGRRRAYARSHRGNDADLMHRVVTGVHGRFTIVDHKNHDSLDNRSPNLRVCSQKENLRNQRARGSAGTPFKGLSRHGEKFSAAITVDGRSIHLGMFRTAEDAARAYDEAALRYHGEFALTNATALKPRPSDYGGRQ